MYVSFFIHMYNKLNITENHLRILALFTNGYPQLHIRDIARQLDLAPRTAQLILDNLSKRGILTYEIKGKTMIYQVQINEISEYYLCLAESYKKTAFLNKHFNLTPLAQKLQVQGIAIIFGSYAKNLQKKHSDIDLFITGTYNKEVIKEFEKINQIEIDVKNYPLDAFNTTDVLLKEIIQNHIILSGQESFVKSILLLKSQMDLS